MSSLASMRTFTPVEAKETELINTHVNSTFTPHLPEELWRQIILEADSIDGVSEFSNEPRHQIKLDCFPNNTTSVITRATLRSILKWRLNAVLVCREWAKCAIPILWGHLYPSIRQISHIIKTLLRNPERKLYVQRITINTNVLDLAWELQQDQDRRYRENIDLIPQLIDACPRLLILDAPLLSKGFTIPPTVKHLTLTVLPSTMDQFLIDPFQTLLQDIKSLTLNLGEGGIENLMTNSHSRLELPKLQVLCLTNTLNTTWASRLISMWSLPSLQILSMFPDDTSVVIPLVAQFPSLRHLQLSRLGRRDWTGSELFTMKRLTRIDIIWNLNTINRLTGITNRSFPELRTIGVYWKYYAEAPRDLATKNRFGEDCSSILRLLHEWCLPSAKIVLSGFGRFCGWVTKYYEVEATITRLMSEGREVVRVVDPD